MYEASDVKHRCHWLMSKQGRMIRFRNSSQRRQRPDQRSRQPDGPGLRSIAPAESAGLSVLIFVAEEM
jgi:hypothetical protein